jgi:hypothetical protein
VALSRVGGESEHEIKGLAPSHLGRKIKSVESSTSKCALSLQARPPGLLHLSAVARAPTSIAACRRDANTNLDFVMIALQVARRGCKL